MILRRRTLISSLLATIALALPVGPSVVEVGSAFAAKPCTTPVEQLLRSGETKSRCPKRYRSQIFAPDSVWNKKVKRNVAISPSSDIYVDRLQDTIAQYGSWVNTTKWSSPIYRVGRHAPTETVTLDKDPSVNLNIRQDFAQVPVPDHAVASNDLDSNMIVWQPSTDSVWEMWGAGEQADGWHMRYGGKFKDLSANPGFLERADGGATATGLPLFGGMIRLSELRRGKIKHALSLRIPEPRSGCWTWPAQRTDGTSSDPTAIPEGTKLRLDPSLDLDSMGLPRFTLMVAKAAQRYGIIVSDKGGAVAFAAEDPTPTGTNPYAGPNGHFGGKYPSQLLSVFPWEELQVIDAPSNCPAP